MTLQEAERRRRQSERDRADDHRQWCELNGFSKATGKRILNSDAGPVVTQLSPRRIGITVANNIAWQESRARSA